MIANSESLLLFPFPFSFFLFPPARKDTSMQNQNFKVKNAVVSFSLLCGYGVMSWISIIYIKKKISPFSEKNMIIIRNIFFFSYSYEFTPKNVLFLFCERLEVTFCLEIIFDDACVCVCVYECECTLGESIVKLRRLM